MTNHRRLLLSVGAVLSLGVAGVLVWAEPASARTPDCEIYHQFKHSVFLQPDDHIHGLDNAAPAPGDEYWEYEFNSARPIDENSHSDFVSGQIASHGHPSPQLCVTP